MQLLVLLRTLLLLRRGTSGENLRRVSLHLSVAGGNVEQAGIQRRIGERSYLLGNLDERVWVGVLGRRRTFLSCR